MIKNFRFTEFIESSISKTLGITNIPDDFVTIDNLLFTAQKMQEVRDFLGKPVIVSSAYRCDQVNNAVGGSKRSQHLIGQAVDFVCPACGDPYKITKALRDSDIEFDQLIYEGSWIHISFKKINNRKMVLTKMKDEKGKIIYRSGLHYYID